MKPLAATTGRGPSRALSRTRAATLAVTLSVPLTIPFLGGCSGTSGGGRSATAATTQGATTPGQRRARVFYSHDLRIELQDGKRIELSSCAESLQDCEGIRTAMGRTTDVAKNVTGTCERVATAECFSQPGVNGRPGYFCARTREQCDMRRIIQGTQLPANPCITAIPGRASGETTGEHEGANVSRYGQCRVALSRLPTPTNWIGFRARAARMVSRFP